ncbi:MAG: 50S ribosomal protein P1 [Candidatus Aenigmatarchaeota archaeon]
MEMIYSALLLHSAKQNVDEANITKVLQAAGISPDAAKVKAVVASLDGVNIEEAISKAAMPVAAAPAEAGAAKKEAKDEDDTEKKAEQAVEGLAGLFG